MGKSTSTEKLPVKRLNSNLFLSLFDRFQLTIILEQSSNYSRLEYLHCSSLIAPIWTFRWKWFHRSQSRPKWERFLSRRRNSLQSNAFEVWILLYKCLKYSQIPGGYALRTLKAYGETMFSMNKSKLRPFLRSPFVSHHQTTTKNSLRWRNTKITSNATKATLWKNGVETWDSLSRSRDVSLTHNYGTQMIFMPRAKRLPC